MTTVSVGFPVILSSPSGGGKTSIARLLLARRGDVGYSVSCTTRSPRPDEVEGQDYYFLAPDEFRARAARGEFAEYAEVHGNLYGTLRREVARVLAGGRKVVMDIDVQGARAFVGAYPQAVLIFLLPPSADVLVSRLRGRGTEGAAPLARRMRNALDELRAAEEYQYLIVNDVLEETYRRVAAVLDAEDVRHARHWLLADRASALLADLARRLEQIAQPGE